MNQQDIIKIYTKIVVFVYKYKHLYVQIRKVKHSSLDGSVSNIYIYIVICC